MLDPLRGCLLFLEGGIEKHIEDEFTIIIGELGCGSDKGR